MGRSTLYRLSGAQLWNDFHELQLASNAPHSVIETESSFSWSASETNNESIHAAFESKIRNGRESEPTTTFSNDSHYRSNYNRENEHGFSKSSFQAPFPPRRLPIVSNSIDSDDANDDDDTILEAAHASDDDKSMADADSDVDSEVSMIDMDEFDATPRLPIAKIKLLGNTITVWSETENQVYKISVNLIRCRVRKLKYDDDETIFDIVNETVQYHKRTVLKHALSWLRTQKLVALPDNDKDAVTQTHEYIDLYWLAHIHDVRSLQNTIMDCFRARKICEQGYFARKLIARVYENSVQSSKIRKYLVDMFVFKSHCWERGEMEAWLESHEAYGEENARFVNDVKVALEKVNLAPENPNLKPQCAYHHHYTGERCA